MDGKVDTTPAAIEPASASRFRPFTEDAAAEGHVLAAGEDAGFAPEGGLSARGFTEGDDDTAGIEPDGLASSKQ